MAVVAADEPDRERVDAAALLLLQPLLQPAPDGGPLHLAGGRGRRAGDLLERLGSDDLEARERVLGDSAGG